MMRLLTSLYALVAGLGLASCAPSGSRDTGQPMRVETGRDLERFLGLWYEVARFPNRFERGCAGVTAEYARRPDGAISVVNTFRKGNPDGPVDRAKGVARVVGPGKLEVSFVPWLPFAKGNDWVLHADPAYSVAVVGEPGGRTGWILARAPQLAPEKYDKAVSVLRTMGYDTAQLQLVAP